MCFAAFVSFFLVFSLVFRSAALSSGNPVSIRPPRLRSRNIVKMTIPHLFTNPIILEKGSKQKISGCLLQVLEVHNGWLLTSFKEDSSFFSVTLQVRHQPGLSAGNHALWKHWIIKSLSAHAQCSFTSVRVYVNVYVWVYFCLAELLKSLLTRDRSNETFHFPLLPGQWTWLCVLQKANTHIHTPWSKYIQHVQTEAHS